MKNKLVVNKPKKKRENRKKYQKVKKSIEKLSANSDFSRQAAFLGSLYLYYCVSGSKQLAYIVIIVKLRRINQIEKTINKIQKKKQQQNFQRKYFFQKPKNTKKEISNIFKRINYIYTCTCM